MGLRVWFGSSWIGTERQRIGLVWNGWVWSSRCVMFAVWLGMECHGAAWTGFTGEAEDNPSPLTLSQTRR